MSFAQDNVCFFFADAPRFCKPVAQDDVRFFFALLRLSHRPDNIKFSFCFFVGIVQPTGWQGTTSTTKERKENDQAVTIDKSSDPVLSSFRRRPSTHWMGGHDVYYKRTKENDQAATINNNSDTRATINNNNSPLPRKSNNKLCVLAVELE
jgi:hypothetical protein